MSNKKQAPLTSNGGSEDLIATDPATSGVRLTEVLPTTQECVDAWATARFAMERASNSLDRKGILRALDIFSEMGIMDPKKTPQSAAEADFINAFFDMIDAKNKLFAIQEAELQKEQN